MDKFNESENVPSESKDSDIDEKTGDKTGQVEDIRSEPDSEALKAKKNRNEEKRQKRNVPVLCSRFGRCIDWKQHNGLYSLGIY